MIAITAATATCRLGTNFLPTYKKTVDLSHGLDMARMPAPVRDNILSFLHKQTGRISVVLNFLLTRLTA